MHRHRDLHSPSMPPMPLLQAMSAAPHGGRALEGMGRGKKPKEATERKHAWAGGRVRHQPGPGCVLPKLGAQKLLLFTPQLCPSRRQSRACPGLGLGFSTRWVLGLTRQRAWCGGEQEGHAPAPSLLSPESLTNKHLPVPPHQDGLLCGCMRLFCHLRGDGASGRLHNPWSRGTGGQVRL